MGAIIGGGVLVTAAVMILLAPTPDGDATIIVDGLVMP
jgi:hypothetical protein